MSGSFQNGVSINKVRVHPKCKLKYHRLKAGPQRDQYVHDIVMRSRILGRREEFERDHPGQPIPDTPWYSLEFETVDHVNGRSLDVEPTNLEPVTYAENNRRMQERLRRKKEAKKAAKEVKKARKTEKQDAPF